MRKLPGIFIGGIILFGVCSFLAWIHQTVTIGLNPVVGYGCLLLAIVVAVSFGIKFLDRMMRRLRQNKGCGTDSLFVMGALAWLLRGVYSAVFDKRNYLDIQLHDTYFIIAPLHAGLAMAFLFVIVGGLYFTYFLFISYSSAQFPDTILLVKARPVSGL